MKKFIFCIVSVLHENSRKKKMFHDTTFHGQENRDFEIGDLKVSLRTTKERARACVCVSFMFKSKSKVGDHSRG